MNDNNDLLNLCRLNLLEQHIEESDPNEKNDTLNYINYKRNNLTEKLSNNGLEFTPNQMKKHVEENTKNGVYPWTDGIEEIYETDDDNDNY